MSEPNWNITCKGPTFFIIELEGRMVAKIHPNGEVELGEGLSPSDAAKAFWEALANCNPLRQRVRELEEQVKKLEERLKERGQ